MKLNVIGKANLKRPPTSLAEFNNRIYVSTKGKRIFYSEDMKSFKSIICSAQANCLESNSKNLFICQKDGKVFALDKSHKTTFKATVGEASATKCLYYIVSEDIFVGSENRKVTSFGKNSLLKNSFYFGDTTLCNFDLSSNGLLAVSSQNDQTVSFIELNTKHKSSLKVLDGFPEVLTFLKNDLFLVSTTTGSLSCFNLINKKRVSFLKFEHAISFIKDLGNGDLLIGVPKKIFLINLSNLNKFEIIESLVVDGMPVDCVVSDFIYVGVSRESRLSRHMKVKDGKNQILKIKIE